MSPTTLFVVLTMQFSAVGAVTGWNADYGRAVEVARRQNRPLVVVLEDRSQPQPTASILSNSAVRMTLRKCSVCRLDVQTRRGAAVASRLNATRFPYTVISDRSGRNIVFRGSSDLSEDAWLRLLDDVMREPNGGRATADSPEPAEKQPDGQPADGKERARLRVVVIGTNGCAYCERLKVETIPDPDVGRVLDQGMTLEYANAAEDDTLARKHGVTIYPSILVLSEAGDMLDRIDGFVGPTELVARLQACNPRE